MKKLNLTLTVILFSILSGMAQETPRGFNFQAVARFDDGSPKANASIGIVFGIFPDNTSIIPIYKEKQTVSTDQFGVFSATIGQGTPETGAFADVPFQDHDCELAVWQLDDEVEILITRTRLLSVPYAKTADHSVHSDTAQHAAYAAQAFFPAGMVIPFAGPESKIPAGWVLCDGRVLDANDYPGLFDAIGTAWGSGGGSLFRIPDLRGTFLRGVAYASTRDPNKTTRVAINTGGNTGNNVGSYQADIVGPHQHNYYDKHNSDNRTVNGLGSKSAASTTDLIDYRPTTNKSGTGSETRPRNAYVNYIIKL